MKHGNAIFFIMLIMLLSGCSKQKEAAGSRTISGEDTLTKEQETVEDQNGTAEEQETAAEENGTAEEQETAEEQGAEKNQELVEDAEDPLYIAEGIRKLSIVKESKEVLQISYEPEEYESSFEYWKIHVPYGAEAIVDTEAMLQFYHQLEAFEFQTVPKALSEAETGIGDSGTSITVEYRRAAKEERDAALQGEEFEGEFRPSYEMAADSRFTLNIGRKSPAGFYYAALQAKPERIYQLPENMVEAILAVNPFTLILKITAVANVDTVEQVLIKMDEKEYQLQKKEDQYYFGTQEVTGSVYRELYTELLSVFVADEMKAGEKSRDQVILELTFQRNEGAPEDLHIVYLEYDEERASVSVNGVERLLVNRKDVESLKDKIKKSYKI